MKRASPAFADAERLISFVFWHVTTCNNQASSLDFGAGFRSVALMSTGTDALIVIVEDDEEIHRLVRDMLLREGFSVEVADSGEALDHLLML